MVYNEIVNVSKKGGTNMLFIGKKKVYQPKDLILSENHKIEYKPEKNMNTIVIGSHGTDFIKTNLLSKDCSYVVADTNYGLLSEFEHYLMQVKPFYQVQYVDFKHPDLSMNYNPLWQLYTEQDVCEFATDLVTSRDPAIKDSSWINAIINFITGSILFVKDTAPSRQCTMKNVIRIIDVIQEITRQECGYEEFMSKISALMEKSQRAFRYIKDALPENDHVRENLFLTVNEIAAPLKDEKLLYTLEYNDIWIKDIAKNKVALFVIVDEMAHTYDFLNNILFKQIYKEIQNTKFVQEGFGPKEYVRFFFNHGDSYRVKDMQEILSGCRKYDSSVVLSAQSESKLQTIYGEDIINDVTYVYTGTNDISTLKNISDRTGHSIDEIQNMTDTILIFSPENSIIKDNLYDYHNHPDYCNIKQTVRKQHYKEEGLSADFITALLEGDDLDTLTGDKIK